jgi:hypothetical protein
MSKKEGEKANRRDFLKLASVSAPAAAAAVMTTGTQAEASEADTRPGGMKDTAHTRAYYDSARF